MKKSEIQSRLYFRQGALEKLRKAYLALVDGGVKSYGIDDKQLTKLDLPALKKEMDDTEKQIDILTAQLRGRPPRKMVGIVPKDW